MNAKRVGKEAYPWLSVLWLSVFLGVILGLAYIGHVIDTDQASAKYVTQMEHYNK